MSVAERNAIIEEHLWCIDCVVRQNMALVVGAHLDRDDVYQALAERMIRAAARYDSSKGKSLKNYIFDQLKYELKTCASSKARYGFVDAPYGIRNAVLSMESLAEENPNWEAHIAW